MPPRLERCQPCGAIARLRIPRPARVAGAGGGSGIVSLVLLERRALDLGQLALQILLVLALLAGPHAHLLEVELDDLLVLLAALMVGDRRLRPVDEDLAVRAPVPRTRLPELRHVGARRGAPPSTRGEGGGHFQRTTRADLQFESPV